MESIERSEAHHLLPDGALRCVWMSAGIVAFKLCDRDYDCECCPFDRAMCPAPKGASSGIPPHPSDFPADRAYGRGHAWALLRGGSCLRIGIDAVVARLLGRLREVVVPPAGSPLRRGRAGCWLLQETGPLPLKMPASGTVLRRNPRLAAHPELAITAPYGDGWVLEAVCDAEKELRRLLSAGEMRRRTGRQLERLRRRGRPAGPVGRTLADGGELSGDVDGWLGSVSPGRALRALLG